MNWVRATRDNSDEQVWINLAVARTMETTTNPAYTIIAFADGTIVTVKELPENLFGRMQKA